MATSSNRKFSDKLYLGIAPLISGAIILCVYFILGVYPFGERSISYYDMAQSFVPLYYRTWDVLHGTQSLFWDWNVGMGCSMTDVAGAFCLFPSNLFFLFIERENILYSMSFFLMLKIMMSAFSMSYYSEKKYSNRVICVVAGISYAFCGFSLQYYTNIHFLDVVMIFPLLVLALEKLITDGKKIGYIILLVLVFLTNQQIAFTVVIYIVFKGWLEISKEEAHKRGRAIVNLILSSFAALLISAFIFIPAFLQMTGSSRFDEVASVSLIDMLKTVSCDLFEQKLFMLFGGEIGIGCGVFLLTDKNRMRKSLDRVLMILLLALPIMFENINLIWHGGSYQHFPMRFGYMLSFELVSLMCFVFDSKYEKENGEEREVKKTEIALIICIVLIPVILGMIYSVCVRLRTYGIRDVLAYKGYGYIVLVIVMFSIVLCYVRNSKVACIILLAVVMMQSAIGAYGLLAPDDSYAIECEDIFVRNAQSIYDNLDKKDDYSRIKDNNLSLNTNYGLILDQPSLGAWMTGVNPNLQNTMMKMGYSANHIRLLDNGGTVFTDALLGVSREFTADGLVGSKYTMPFGVIMTEEPQGEGFEYQNNLFKAITDIDEKLFVEVDKERTTQKYILEENSDVRVFDMSVEVSGRARLYVYGDWQYDISRAFAFEVNGNQISTDAMGTVGNIMYGLQFVNGYLDLGEYEEENVNIVIYSRYDTLDAIHIGLLNLDILERGISNVNENIMSDTSIIDGVLKMDVTSKTAGKMLIPIGYSDSYMITMDGTKVDYAPVLESAFASLDIDAGKHVIEIKYVPIGINIGMVCSIVGLILAAVLIAMCKNEPFKKGNKLWYRIYGLVIAVAMMILYVVPMIMWVYVKIFWQSGI